MEVHVRAAQPAPEAVQVALAVSLGDMRHDVGHAALLEVVGQTGHDPPEDVRAARPTVAVSELVDRGGDEGRVGQDQLEALLADRLVEVALEEHGVPGVVEHCVQAREVDRARVDVGPDHALGVAGSQDCVDA